MSYDTSPTTDDSSRRSMNFAMFVVHTWATSLEVFLHARFGSRYLGNNAAAVVLLVPFYTLLWQDFNVMPLVWFLGIYLLLCFCHRMDGHKRRAKRQEGHSYYSGIPLLMAFIRRSDERMVKLIVEPLLVGIAAFFVAGLNRPLGFYLFWGAVCMAFANGKCELRAAMKARDLNDAVIEQQIIAERFRSMRGDRY